jgi:hypothetical protein
MMLSMYGANRSRAAVGEEAERAEGVVTA